MKQLSSFMVMNIDGGDRVSFTYNEIDEKSGNLISANNKESFFAVDRELQNSISSIRKFIKENKLGD